MFARFHFALYTKGINYINDRRNIVMWRKIYLAHLPRRNWFHQNDELTSNYRRLSNVFDRNCCYRDRKLTHRLPGMDKLGPARNGQV